MTRKRCSHYEKKMHPGYLAIKTSPQGISTCPRGNMCRGKGHAQLNEQASVPFCFFFPTGCDVVYKIQKAALSKRACHEGNTKKEREHGHPILVSMHWQCEWTIRCNAQNDKSSSDSCQAVQTWESLYYASIENTLSQGIQLK